MASATEMRSNIPNDSAPSRPRSEGQRGGRARGRGRGGNTNGARADGERPVPDSRGARRGRGGNRGGNPSRREDSSTMNTSDLAARFSQQKTQGGDLGQQTGNGKQVADVGKEPAAAGAEEEDLEAEVCFICASAVVHNSVAPCNHRTCHICALRMRALYKTKDCAHCRVSKSAAPPSDLYILFCRMSAQSLTSHVSPKHNM